MSAYLPIALASSRGWPGADACHPDRALLDLCDWLTLLQEEWQRLYEATSNADELTTAVDHAWQDYSDNVWPGIGLSDWNRIRAG